MSNEAFNDHQSGDGREAHFRGGAPVSRRHFLHGVGLVGAGLAAAKLPGLDSSLPRVDSSLLGGSSSIGKTFPGSPQKTPKRGGTLRMAITGNGTSETYDPALANTPVDGTHCDLVYDSMVRSGAYYHTEPGLVTAWLPNKDATVWELHLREGVTWHNGKPFTADDLIYTMKLMGNPSHLGHFAVANVNLNEIKKLSNTKVRLPLQLPIAQPWNYFNYANATWVVQDGQKDFTHPIGTGPYILESFTPGQRSVLKRNPNYWDDHKPYPDSFELLSIDDDTARLNALQSKQIDICSGLTYAQAKIGSTSNYYVIENFGGFPCNFTMRVDRPPFTDNRVRQAFELLINRPKMAETVFSGFATPLNNLPCEGFPFYDNNLPKVEQDIPQAKHLLKAAGHEDLRVTLQTTNGGFAQVQWATAFAEQAAAAGVKVKVQNEPPASYYDPNLLFTKMTFAQNIWAISSMNQFYSAALVKGATQDETAWHSNSFDQLFYKAQGELNQAKAQNYWNQLQKIQYEQGGYIFWAQVHNLSAIATNVAGYYGPGLGWLGGGEADWGFV